MDFARTRNSFTRSGHRYLTEPLVRMTDRPSPGTSLMNGTRIVAVVVVVVVVVVALNAEKKKQLFFFHQMNKGMSQLVLGRAVLRHSDDSS
ncbi:hypothetical protein F2P81_015558 [Scophthalmus maximus]|uniref:Uncharacterized protein n=1 Tax=Scophthalmus maximus TaxID=52904 RepID=A0A6A4SM90_SCOMX|nr:hypothetical protein F2P81_015558 [Scophthalmus maximus]